MEKDNVTTIPVHSGSEQAADPRIALSVERTELALERTQLAWIRTTLTFLGGGIGLDKGLEAIHKQRIESGNAWFDSVHVLGIALSIAATLVILMSTIHYFIRSKSLAKMKGFGFPYANPTIYGSCLVFILGVAISFLLIVT
jgi:putative membrane protein